MVGLVSFLREIVDLKFHSAILYSTNHSCIQPITNGALEVALVVAGKDEFCMEYIVGFKEEGFQ